MLASAVTTPGLITDVTQPDKIRFPSDSDFVFLIYRKPEEEKEKFWNELFDLVSCIPEDKMVVLAEDMKGHVGSSNVGYDGTHGCFG